jgi:hypothetical protein
MADYPTLTVLPSVPIKESTEDPVIRSNSEAGYLHTRKRFTKARHSFSLNYEKMPNADKVALDAFCDVVGGGVSSFTWVHPITSTSYTVRFNARPEFTSGEHDGTSYRWTTGFILTEV